MLLLLLFFSIVSEEHNAANKGVAKGKDGIDLIISWIFVELPTDLCDDDSVEDEGDDGRSWNDDETGDDVDMEMPLTGEEETSEALLKLGKLFKIEINNICNQL